MRTFTGSVAALCASLWALPALPAAAQQYDPIWSCVDEQGHKVFQNYATGHDCHRIDGVVATVPATAAPRPSARSSASSATSGVTPANFPRVDRDVQRARDVDRHRILEDELRTEEARLVRLREEYNFGNPRLIGDETAISPSYRERFQRLVEDIQRSEVSVTSLKRELTPARY